MRSILRVFRREAGSYFASPVAYLFIGTFLAVTLFIFFWAETFFARNIADLRPLFEWLPILLIALVATLTMRSWSEEHRSGTVELLMTSSASPLALVLGKLLAIMALVAVALVLTLPLPVTVAFLGPLDWGPVVGGYVASLFLAAAYAAIGLFISARTDNPVVSLMATAVVGGVFYVVGTEWLTSLAPQPLADLMRAIGTGARFDEITRGVLDGRDIYYYVSLIGVFVALNVYNLERLRIGPQQRAGARLNGLRVVAGLVAVNFLAANLWMTGLTAARADLTSGNRYSLGAATEQYIANLQQPLTLKAYISGQAHPLLKPLAPQLRDLLTEYGVQGGNRVNVEIVDPSKNEEAAERARKRFGIEPVPLRTASRYESSVVSTYFHVVVRYGDQHTVLGLQDLIRSQTGGDAMEVNLDNPEYQVTSGIREVARKWRSGGNVFATINEPLTFDGYISKREALPDELAGLRDKLDTILEDLKAQAGDKLTTRITDPGGPDSEVAKRLRAEHGFRPLVTSLGSDERFYFHMVLSSGDRSVPVKLPAEPSEDALRDAIKEGLKRFAEGLQRTIAAYQPESGGGGRRQRGPQGPSYGLLLRSLRENNNVVRAKLDNGRVPDNADLLLVLSPTKLGDKARFAIDQFLMRGGTVVVAGSSQQIKISRRRGIRVSETVTGLADWLQRYGVDIGDELVLDPQSGSLTLPTTSGGRPRMQSMDYPYFIDVRPDGMADVPMLSSLNQVSLAWMSPIAIDEENTGEREVTRLLRSSKRSWTAKTDSVVPQMGQDGLSGFPEADERGRRNLAVMLEGRFESAFKDKEPPELSADGGDKERSGPSGRERGQQGPQGQDDQEDQGPTVTSVIGKSAGSSRLVVLGSGNFVTDSALRIAGRSRQGRYTAPTELIQNVIDWSLEDPAMLALRGQSRSGRPLVPLEDWQRRAWETGNYGVALAGLLMVFGIQRWARNIRRRQYATWLNREGDQ